MQLRHSRETGRNFSHYDLNNESQIHVIFWLFIIDFLKIIPFLKFVLVLEIASA